MISFEQREDMEMMGIDVDVETPDQITRPPDVNQRDLLHQTRRSFEIYYEQLVVKNRGSPLWVPAPNTILPLSYQRQGISIGDVGIITEYGGFDFLFNIFLPSGHVHNPEELPEEFKPLEPLRRGDVTSFSAFGPDSYLSSSSVTKFQRNDIDPSELVFESDKETGAILTMPKGSTAKDLGNRMRIRRYTAHNAQCWYRYVYNVHGQKPNNGDLRVVIGTDQSSAWGMAIFSKTTSHSQNALRLKFKPNRDHNPDAGQLYDWECEGGVFEGRTGPHADELAALRAGDPDEADAVYENQCLFLRTLNVKLDENTWRDLIAEMDLGFVQNDPTYMTPSPQPSSFSHTLASSSRMFENQARFLNYTNTTLSGLPQISRPPSALAIHPLNYTHDKLLMDYPNAGMVITEDDIWISVLTQNEVVMPEKEELYRRIMTTYTIVEEDGFIFLDSTESKEAPTCAVKKNSSVQEDKAGTRPYYEIFQGIPVGIEKLVVASFTSPLHYAVNLLTDLGHSNIVSPHAEATVNPLYISLYMKGGTLIQFLENLVSSKALRYPTLQLGLPQPKQGISDEEEISLLKMVHEVANGMAYLHSQGISHGTLKAANILLFENNSCVISDFRPIPTGKVSGEDAGAALKSCSSYTAIFER